MTRKIIKNPYLKWCRGLCHAPRQALMLLCLLLPVVTLQSVSAHQQRSAITRILFNPNTGNLEVMHRFLLHDVEHAATFIFGEKHNLLESATSRELFGNYVINRFAITAHLNDGAQQALTLDHIGEEVDGQYLWVYQEIPQPEPSTLAGMTIVHSVLRDVWPDQHNLVNIELNKEVHSLGFVSDVEELTVNLNEARE
ncbi:MAG: DUF6702 family protein [Pseudohongiellaceae bacterium]